MEIRKANASSAEEICQLLKRSIKELCVLDHDYDEVIIHSWLINKTTDNVAKWINAHPCSYVACEQEQIIGFILMDDQGNLLLNYVLPEYLHQGAGKALLEKIECYAKKHHISTIKVNSTLTARDFYLKQGFEYDTAVTTTEGPIKEFALIKVLSAKV